MRLELHAPSDVKVGEVFEARLELQASRELVHLAFAVSYDKSRLALVGWSGGEFARQWGLPAELTAQEPSDGNIEVNLTANRGHAFAGAGLLALLQFEALKGGTSAIAPRNPTSVDRAGAADTNVIVLRESRVTIH